METLRILLLLYLSGCVGYFAMFVHTFKNQWALWINISISLVWPYFVGKYLVGRVKLLIIRAAIKILQNEQKRIEAEKQIKEGESTNE